ncbi:hypothetical protein E4U53_004952, partial [Claviceps sorghi]
MYFGAWPGWVARTGDANHPIRQSSWLSTPTPTPTPTPRAPSTTRHDYPADRRRSRSLEKGD